MNRRVDSASVKPLPLPSHIDKTVKRCTIAILAGVVAIAGPVQVSLSDEILTRESLAERMDAYAKEMPGIEGSVTIRESHRTPGGREHIDSEAMIKITQSGSEFAIFSEFSSDGEQQNVGTLSNDDYAADFRTDAGGVHSLTNLSRADSLSGGGPDPAIHILCGIRPGWLFRLDLRTLLRDASSSVTIESTGGDQLRLVFDATTSTAIRNGIQRGQLVLQRLGSAWVCTDGEFKWANTHGDSARIRCRQQFEDVNGIALPRLSEETRFDIFSSVTKSPDPAVYVALREMTFQERTEFQADEFRVTRLGLPEPAFANHGYARYAAVVAGVVIFALCATYTRKRRARKEGH